MTDYLRNWVLGLAGTAVLCAAATILTPEGRVKRVVNLLCGAAMTAALLSPLLGTQLPDYGLNLATYRAQARRLTDDAEELSRNLDRNYIEDEMEAYILDKAAQLGAALDGVTVELRWSVEGGVWVPVSAGLDGAYHPALARLLEAELGIPECAQSWRNDENP